MRHRAADIAESMRAVYVQVGDAALTHIWSVVTPWPANAREFVRCVAQQSKIVTYLVTHQNPGDE